MLTSTEIKHHWTDIVYKVKTAAAGCGLPVEDISIIAVSKSDPPGTIVEGIEAGIRLFGENYVQELIEKFTYLDANHISQPEWHFIWHLQRNKVKYIAPFISMIHSVDLIN